jgi:hypothetical protein
VFLAETHRAAGQLGIELQTSEAHNPNKIEKAFQFSAAQDVDALIVFDDPVLWSNRKQIVALAATRNIPTLYGSGSLSMRADSSPMGQIALINIVAPRHTWTKYSKGQNHPICPSNNPRDSSYLSISRLRRH